MKVYLMVIAAAAALQVLIGIAIVATGSTQVHVSTFVFVNLCFLIMAAIGLYTGKEREQ